MPSIRNLTKQLLHLRIGQDIEPEGSLDVTDEQAAQLAGHPLLDIPTGKPTKKDGESK